VARFDLVQDASGRPELDGLYREITASGFGAAGVPINWFTAQGERPDIVATTWALVKGILIEGQLPPTLKQLIALTVSAQNSCRYCEATHSGALEAMGVSREVIERSVSDPGMPDLPAPHRAVLQFALKAARSPNLITDEDHQALRDAGFSRGEIMEVIMMAAFTQFINIWADAGGLPLDGGG